MADSLWNSGVNALASAKGEIIIAAVSRKQTSSFQGGAVPSFQGAFVQTLDNQHLARDAQSRRLEPLIPSIRAEGTSYAHSSLPGEQG